MNPLIIHHNLGLGDHIICNGLVRYLFNEGKYFTDVYVFCKEKYAKSVSCMYGDDNRIHILPISNDPNIELTIVNAFIGQNTNIRAFIRSQNCIIDNLKELGLVSTWDEGFYVCCGVPFEKRWTSCKINRNLDRENHLRQKLGISEHDKFVLVHDQGSWGGKLKLTIDSNFKKIYMEPITDSIFDWCGLAEQAEEVHCIDSSFIHLAQMLNIKHGVYHDARGTPIFKLKTSWSRVCYKNQTEHLVP